MKTEIKQSDFQVSKLFDNLPVVHRIDANGQRYYYIWKNGKPLILSSGTTLISDGYPEDLTALTEWKVRKRLEGKDPDHEAQVRATFGTIMHVLYKEIFIGKKIPLNNLRGYTDKLLLGLDKDLYNEVWNRFEKEMVKDLFSLVQWIKDYDVVPLAIELMVASEKLMVATAVDLIAKMTIKVKGETGEVYKSGKNKGQPKIGWIKKRIVGIVDFKSGKKGFYDKHVLQLGLNKLLLEENVPNLKIDGVFNFSPKDWRSAPSYNFKQQDLAKAMRYLPLSLEMGKLKHLDKKKQITVIDGELSIEKDWNELYKVYELEEYIEMVHKNRIELISKLGVETLEKLKAKLNEMTGDELLELAGKLNIEDVDIDSIKNYVVYLWKNRSK